MSILAGLVRRIREAAKRDRDEPNSGVAMRFLVMAMATKASQQGPPPKPEAFVAMQQYNEKAIKAGILLAAEGLTPKGARVEFDGGERTVLDGPFTETKEMLAGFSIIKVDSMEEAITWVKNAPYDASSGKGVVEIRRLMEIEDFGEGFTPNKEIAKIKF